MAKVEKKLNKFQNILSFNQPEKFRGKNKVIVQFWWIVQSTIFACSPQFMYRWRVWLLRTFGAEIGANVIIRPSAKVTYPWKLKIGDNCWVGDEVTLYTLGCITIGDNVVISQRSYICTGSHDYQKTTFDIYAKEINIENEAWVSTDVFIAPGVTIGRAAVIGARSSVFSDMPGEMVCIGAPARPIKHRLN